jgi:Fe-S cluster assembly protein SufD
MFATAFASIKPTIAWLDNLRQHSFNQFLLQGLPTTNQDQWKYTDISSLTKNNFILSEKHPTGSDVLNGIHWIPNSHRVIFYNGFFRPELSKLNNLPKEVIITSFADACQNHSDLIEPYLRSHAGDNAFDFLNLALMQDGLLLLIPENVFIDRPIQVLHLYSNQQDSMQHSRNVIVIGKSSQVTLIEEFSGSPHQIYLQNQQTLFHLKEYAGLTYIKYQNENRDAYHIAQVTVQQETQSHFQAFNFSVGGKIARDDLVVSLNGNGANCNLQGYYHVNDEQHIDQHTRINHYVPNTTSYELYKSVLEAKAIGVFNGKIIVHPHAQRIKAQLRQQTLLMAKTAEMNTKPELEIYADDVKCNHGATVGRIDDTALFYARSRGINQQTAIQMLVAAFANEIVEQIANQDIRQWLLTKQKLSV